MLAYLIDATAAVMEYGADGLVAVHCYVAGQCGVRERSGPSYECVRTVRYRHDVHYRALSECYRARQLIRCAGVCADIPHDLAARAGPGREREVLSRR